MLARLAELPVACCLLPVACCLFSCAAEPAKPASTHPAAGSSATTSSRAPDNPVIPEPGPPIVVIPPPAPGTPVDRFGDPLPPGALARFGTARLFHGGTVDGVARFGDFLVTAGSGLSHHGPTVLFWDAKTSRLAATSNVDGVHAIAASRDGKSMVAISFDGAFLFRAEGSLVTSVKLPKRDGAHVGVAITDDGKTAAVLRSTGCEIDLYVTSPLREKATVPCPAGSPKTIAISDDAALIGVGDEGGPLFVVEVDKREVLIANAPPDKLRDPPALAFVPRSEHLIEARANGTLARWDARKGARVYEVKEAFEGEGRSIAVSDSARDVVVGSVAGHADVTVLEALDGKKHWEAENAGWAAFGYSVAFGDETVIVGTGKGDVLQYELRSGKLLAGAAGNGEDVNAVGFLDEDRLVSLGTELDLWSVSSPAAPAKHPLPGEIPNDFVMSAKRDAFFVRRGRTLEKIRLSDFSVTGAIEDLDGDIQGISGDGRYVYLSVYGSFERIDTSTMKKAPPLPGSTEKRTASCVAVSPDGKRVAAVLEEKMMKSRLYRWESTAGKPTIVDLFAEGEDTLACVFSKSGALVVGTQTGIYTVDRRGTSKKVVEDRYLWRIVPDPKRERVAFADSDEKIALLDLETGTVREVGEHKGSVDALAFSPSGERLASGSADNSVLVWDVR